MQNAPTEFANSLLLTARARTAVMIVATGTTGTCILFGTG